MEIEEIKRISIVSYLSKMGYEPCRKLGHKYWYLSPLHRENNSSFKVDVDINLWYDFSVGTGGNIINLVSQLHPLMSMNDVINHLKDFAGKQDFVCEQHTVPDKETLRIINETKQNATNISRLVELNHPNLLEYVRQRSVSDSIARKYCKEVYYTSSDGKRYYAIAFLNRSGGMEARNRYYKRCIGKKDISIIEEALPAKHCCVFEGFFDFLSYKTAEAAGDALAISEPCDSIILNSVVLVEKALPLLHHYECVHLYLDNDHAGKTAFQSFEKALQSKVIDESFRYKEYGDVNDYLTKNKKSE